MLLTAVMDELGDKLKGADGLRVYSYDTESFTSPAAVVHWPDTLTFDSAFVRGADMIDIPITVAVGQVNSRTARDLLAKYCAGDGATSIKTILEESEYTSCSSVRVKQVTFATITISKVEYLAALFDVEVIGVGDGS